MHTSLAVTPKGLPLGLAAVKFWSRDKFEATAQLKRRINPTRVPIETKESIRWLDNLRQSIELPGRPGRCIHVGDRESDIYELYCLSRELGSHFVVRTVVDRLASDGNHTVATEMRRAKVAGRHVIEVRDENDTVARVALEIRFRRIHVLPPIGKQKRYPALDLTVIHATEVDPPAERKPIHWKLLTDLKVESAEQAIEKIGWYALRWKIEGLPQGPQIRLSCRRRQAADCRSPGQSHRRILHRQLAGHVAHHARQNRFCSPPGAHPD
jgi:hypothetical protein